MDCDEAYVAYSVGEIDFDELDEICPDTFQIYGEDEE